ncbi:MAG: hypothetical protein KME14_20495 [Tildeniella torsiva UHER 1998/13D]|jgi:hypothetical protein|nr:hypothetical protein [Tildeniella torsiva UHER 1998/13D]
MSRIRKSRPRKAGKLPDEETIARRLTAYLNQRGLMKLEQFTTALALSPHQANCKAVHAVAVKYAPYVHHPPTSTWPIYYAKPPRGESWQRNPKYNQPEKETMGLQRTTEEIEAAIDRALELLPQAKTPGVDWVRKTANVSTSWLYRNDPTLARVKRAVQAEKERREADFEAVADQPIPYVLVKEPEALTPQPPLPEGEGEPESYPLSIEKEGEEDLVADQAEDYERQIAELHEQLKAVVRRNEELEYKLTQVASATPATPTLPAVSQGDLVERLHTLDVEVAAIRGEMQRLELLLEQKLDDANALRRALDLLGLTRSEAA